MASTAITTAGTTFEVSASLPATYDASGFGALAYTLTGEVTDIGEFGKTYEVITHNPIADRKTYKFKGNYNNGALTIALAYDASDAGQVILKNYLDLDTDLSIKITNSDATVDYFTGKVVSYQKAVASGSVLTGSVSIEINSDIVEV